MKCPKCGCESFILETTVIVTEEYKIYKNGKVSNHPIKTKISNYDMAENDNIIRCTNCNIGYVIPQKSRFELINKTDFSKIDLKTEGIETEY